MYHFTADHPPEPVRLSFRALIPGHIRQYLKDFQIDAIRFMHNYLAKGEFCVYNDESGLGKQAAVVVLLDAACSSRKCLIIVQNDDRYITGWEFHFNVLTNTNVTIIKDEKDTTDSAHSIYIAKWSTLRTIDDLSKFKFDFIILDNRGQMLNNSFCTSMLLKHYEHKISILISSVDITSDLRLLHNVLRLGGRLEPRYFSFKVFEEKFKLPDAKELAYKRVDLEEYFCKRERLADYCKAFRLRRYCHQFETQLPLVKEDRYKINLNLWREKQNATNSESSSIEFLNNQNREDEQIKDTQELFEEYCRQRRKQHLQFQHEEEQRLQQREREILKSLGEEKDIIYSVDDEVALINDTPPLTLAKPPVVRDNSDEPILMSPLMVESDSDIDDMPEICNDQIANIEIVDLSSEEQIEEAEKQNQEISFANDNIKEADKNAPKRKSFKKQYEVIRLEEDIADNLKMKPLSTRSLRHKQVINNKLKKREMHETISKNKRLNKEKAYRKYSREVSLSLEGECKPNEKNTKESKSNLEKTCNENRKDLIKRLKTEVKGRTLNDKNKSRNSNAVGKRKNKMIDNSNKIETSGITTPLTSRKTRLIKSMGNIVKEASVKTNENQLKIKQEPLEETPHTGKKCSLISQKLNSEKLRLKRKMDKLSPSIHLKETRSMQRLTRSAGGSKYLTKNLSLQIDKIKKPKRNTFPKKESKSDGRNGNKGVNEGDAKQVAANINKKEVKSKTKSSIENTQTSVISHRSSPDYESLQCAQRLSADDAFDNGVEKTTKFLVPPAPNIILRNSLIPSSLTSSAGFFTESEILLIPPTTATNKRDDQVVLLSSSDNDNSTSESSSTNVSLTSRRTRALKPKRKQQQHIVDETSKVPTFSDLLTHQNTHSSAKSPDLFSNCSDLIQLPCTQPNRDSEEPNTPFEGFKIFGSEVKQLQQHYASNKNNISKLNMNLKKSHREHRSCLDILEKMFEPSNKKSKALNNEKLSTPTKSSSRGAAAANKQKRHTQILPSHPIEAIAEARQQHEIQKSKRSVTTSSSALPDDDIFEITNNGTFGSVMRLHSNGDISPVQTQKTNAKQHNKITNYLIGNAVQNSSQEQTTPNSGNSASNFSTEAGTPSKRHQQLSAVQNVNVKKSPKGKCNVTQTTKLTKWFTKPSELNSHEKSSNTKKTTAKDVRTSQEVGGSITALPALGKRILKRRRLDLSFNK